MVENKKRRRRKRKKIYIIEKYGKENDREMKKFEKE